MEEFQNKIKGFLDLLQYTFEDFFKETKDFSLSFLTILSVEAVLLYYVNSAWIVNYLSVGDKSLWESFLGADNFTIILSIIIILLMAALKFLTATLIREGVGIRIALEEGIKSVLKILMPIILFGGIISGFFIMVDSGHIFVVLAGLGVYFWVNISAYVVLKEKRKGMEAFVKGLYTLRKNLLAFVWKIVIFYLILFLAVITVVTPFALLYLFFSIPYLLTLVVVSALVLFFIAICIFINIYLSVLCENLWKIRKHIAFSPPHFLYILAVNVFLFVVLFILILVKII